MTREVDGKRGFEVYMGGGLGTVPQQAKLFDEFLPEEELLPIAQATARVFARLGEKKNRNTARLKFLVTKLGMDEFKRLVLAERAILPHDPAWTAYLKDVDKHQEEPLKQPSLLQIGAARPEGFDAWHKSNVYQQRQAGYATVTVALPLGDITADQLRALADIARKYVKETIRTTVEQNIVLRWVSEGDLPALYSELKAAGLARRPAPGPSSTSRRAPAPTPASWGSRRRAAWRASCACASPSAASRWMRPSADCTSRSAAASIPAASTISPTSASTASAGTRTATRCRISRWCWAGQWTDNAGSYGLAIGAVPSKRIPEAVDRITDRYLKQRTPAEPFHRFVTRIGKAECKKMIDDLAEIPTHDDDPSFYTDWADAREFTTGDMGVGECAGEVVAPIDFQLTACEREAFEAQLKLEAGDIDAAAKIAYESMLHAASALVKLQFAVAGTIPTRSWPSSGSISTTRSCSSIRFPAASSRSTSSTRTRTGGGRYNAESAHYLIEQAQLFIEAAHSCLSRMAAAQ